MAALLEAGAPLQKEGGLTAWGAFWYPGALEPKAVTRSYAVSGYYNPIKSRTNLQVVVGMRVNEIQFDANKRATGVTIQTRGTPDGQGVQTVTANKEIILCAGWLHTPQILQRSGVGPAALLRQANIPVLVDLPGVGANFQDHAAARATFTCKRPATIFGGWD